MPHAENSLPSRATPVLVCALTRHVGKEITNAHHQP